MNKKFISIAWSRLRNGVATIIMTTIDLVESIAERYFKNETEKIQNEISQRHPLLHFVFKTIGVTPYALLEGFFQYNVKVMRRFGNFTYHASSDVIAGFVNTIAVFRPTRAQWVPRVVLALKNEKLGVNVKKLVKVNGQLVLLGSLLLKWPNLILYYLNNDDSESLKHEDSNSISYVAYALYCTNLLIIYSCRGKVTTYIFNYLVNDILNNIIINDASAKTFCKRPMIVDNINLSEQNSLLSALPSLNFNGLIRSRALTMFDATVKDLILLGGALVNTYLIDSKMIGLGIWLVRARIMGKDLGTSQLAAFNISKLDLQKIQHHRNFRFLGDGLAYYMVMESGTWILKLLGLNNPVSNFALTSLLYKLCIIGNYQRDIVVKKEDISEILEAPNFNPGFLYDGINVEPLINWALTETVHYVSGSFKKADLLKKNFSNNEMVKKSKVDDLKSKSENALMKIYFSESQKMFLLLHSENIYRLVLAIRISKDIEASFIMRYLMDYLPETIQRLFKILGNEITDKQLQDFADFIKIIKKDPELMKLSPAVTNEQGSNSKEEGKQYLKYLGEVIYNQISELLRSRLKDLVTETMNSKDVISLFKENFTRFAVDGKAKIQEYISVMTIENIKSALESLEKATKQVPGGSGTISFASKASVFLAPPGTGVALAFLGNVASNAENYKEGINFFQSLFEYLSNPRQSSEDKKLKEDMSNQKDLSPVYSAISSTASVERESKNDTEFSSLFVSFTPFYNCMTSLQSSLCDAVNSGVGYVNSALVRKADVK